MKEIELTQNKISLVDDEDYEWLDERKWCAACHKEKNIKYYYAVSNGIIMHRLILGLTNKAVLVDHRNHNTLDNRKLNLRICSKAENGFNRHSYLNEFKGVKKVKNKFVARIIYNGKYIHLGTFDFEIDAALAYDEVAKQLFGEYAYLNFEL